MDRQQTKGFRPMFGNKATEQAWSLECVEARAHQVHPLAVAPQCTVITHDGRRLAPGDEVRLERDFVATQDRQVVEHGCWHTVSGSSSVLQLARLVADGIVLDRNGVTVPRVTGSANYVETRRG